MPKYIDKVLVPYVTQTRQKLELSMPLLCLMSSRLIHVTLSLGNYVKLYAAGVHTSWMHWGVATP